MSIEVNQRQYPLPRQPVVVVPVVALEAARVVEVLAETGTSSTSTQAASLTRLQPGNCTPPIPV